MRTSLVLITLSLFYLAGILALGNGLTGITGQYNLDIEGDHCRQNNDCPGEEACCYFYNEGAGICGSTSDCKGIYQATKDAKSLGTEMYSQSSDLRKPSSSTSYVVVGTILVIFGLFGLLNFEKHYKKNGKIKKKR